MPTKKETTRNVFIQATARIIIEDGHEAVTVRKLSQITGYTHPMLYHHFTDLGSLMWQTRSFLISDMIEKLSEFSLTETNIDGVKKAFTVYMEYYLDHPNIFRFFYYFKHKPDAGIQQAEFNFENLWFNTMGFLVKEGLVEASDIEMIAKTIIYSIHGMISLHLSGSDDLSRDKIREELEKVIETVTNRRVKL